MGQQRPVRAADGLLHHRLQQPGGPRLPTQQLAHQRNAQSGTGRVQQQTRIGKIQPLIHLPHIYARFHRPVAPVHFPLAMQGGALFHGHGQQARVTRRVEAVGVQHLETAFGLGTDVVAHRQVDGLAGHVRHFIGAEDPQIDLRMLATEIPQARQQPVPGKRRGGVEHQLIGLLVLPQAANAHRQLLQQRLGGAQQIVTGIGQADAAPTAIEQRLLQVGLKAADLLADRRLGEVQLFGSLVKTAQPGGGFEAAQGAQGRPVFEHIDKFL
ncbi:hypothetical protein D9M71_539570 [compost metagenome]